jgi:hypothetical protein
MQNSAIKTNITKPNWLQSCSERSKKKAKTTTLYSKGKVQPWWETENPAAKDGIYYDKIHQTYEIRQYGKEPMPLSGREFYNQRTGMVEIYEDLSKPPVCSFKRDN